jgi:hypothetical protein
MFNETVPQETDQPDADAGGEGADKGVEEGKEGGEEEAAGE